MKLHIPNPCLAKWEHMTEVDKGRFCSTCKKTVVDFTIMNPKEIQTHLLERQQENVCGRFMKHQLIDYKKSSRQIVSEIVNMMGITSILFLWSIDVKAQDYDRVIKQDTLGTEELFKEETSGEVEFVFGGLDSEIEVEERDYLYYNEVDIKPEFSYGIDSLSNYIVKEIQLPSHYIDYSVLGKMYVEFIINENGFITNARIIKGKYKDVNDEVIRVFLGMPQWTPGRSKKQAVKVKMCTTNSDPLIINLKQK